MELDARIARPRKRMAAGDSDITPDELRAALDLAVYKRRELADIRPANGGEVGSYSPFGAHPQITLKARLALRELLGQIRLEPGADSSLWAAYEIQPAVLVRGAVAGFAG